MRTLQVALIAWLLVACCGLAAQGYVASSITNDFAAHDISASGTILPGGANLDDNLELVNFPAGFSFTFYGAVYTSATVCSNGWLYFGPTQTLSQAQNRDAPLTVPAVVLPNNFVAGCWDDLDPEDALSGKVRVERRSSPDRFIVLWDKIAHFGQAATQIANFAIVLFATGVIEIHYSTGQTIPGPLGVGIEDSSGTIAVPRPGGFATVPTATDAFRWDPPANSPPAISVVRGTGTTPVEIVNQTPIVVIHNTTVAALDLRFAVTDVGTGANLSLAAVVTTSSDISGFVQGEWDAGPSTTQPLLAQPSSGTFNTLVDISVSLTASDGTGGSALFSFILRVQPLPMSGNYTISQTLAADFTSVGAAFDNLEFAGVTGPVTLTIIDSATYVSDPSYTLGLDATGLVVKPVAGASAANRITLIAGPGQQPVIQGNATGAVLYYQSPTSLLTGRGALGIMHSFVTVQGLEVTSGPNFGIMMQGNSSQGLNPFDITVRRCFVHDIPSGPGIAYMGQNSAYATDVIIEHNFVWNCFTTSVATTPLILGNTQGSITVRNPVATSVVRHNTVLHNTTVTTASGGIAFTSSSALVAPCPCQSNVVVVTSTATTIRALHLQSTTIAPDVSGTNFNYWFSTSFCNQATLDDFVLEWQASGRDAGGSRSDPLLVSTAGANIDLHLQPASPCIDPTGQTSVANVDIDGDVRPIGTSTDIGADEFGPPPEIQVLFNAANVADGGIVNIGPVTTNGQGFIFDITNTASGMLRLYGAPVVATPGTNCDATTVVQTQPAAFEIPQSAVATFIVFADPTSVGNFDFTISFANNDGDENPFNFTIEGTAILPNGPAQADPAPGSSFAGPTNGPFTLDVDPAAALANASIQLTDAENDNITVVSITPPNPLPAGIVTPGIPTPAQPIALTWTGSPNSSNAPGLYEWIVTFADAANATQVPATVQITINDIAPAHAIAAAISGDGSAGNPYTGQFTQGDSGASTLNLANVSDANTGQLLNLGAIGVGGGNPGGGAGFQFTLAGGFLTIAPAGTLAAADAGTHAFAVEVTDGTNVVTINVSILVFGATGAITFTTTSLPDGVINVPYNQPISITGATGAATFSVQSGSIPGGLTLSAAGVVTGTPLTLGASTFTVRVVDSANDTATQQFQITINNPAPPPSGTGSSGGGSSGCTAASGATMMALFVVLAVICVLSLRRREAA